MINNRIFLLLLIFIMIICSGKSYKVNEHFILNRTFTLNDIDDKLNDIISKQNELSNKQNKILDKLDYATEYKKLFSKEQSERIKDIDDITEVDVIISELNKLELQELYNNEIKDLNEDKIDNLHKYKNAIKTKYLIDNEFITLDIDETIYQKVEFEPPYGEARYPNHTNDKYFNDKIKPLIDKELSSNPSDFEIEIQNTKIQTNRDKQPEIYIYDEDDNIDTNLDNQIYLNDETKIELEQYIKEYNIELDNVNSIREKIKPDFESGKYIKEGDLSLSRDEYKKIFNVS